VLNDSFGGDERRLIDPDGRYSSDELRQFESSALRVLELLPGASVERTRDVIQINFGDFRSEQGIVVILTPEAIELRLPKIDWVGPHTPVSSSQLWQRVEWNKSEAVNLAELITSVQKAQQQTFRECKYCGKKKPPGWMFRQDVCDSCAEKHLGIVH
jgi:hypothetical protein